ncbi:GrpB family protein [Bacillus sp. HMF5848]|uniref:GrpB family protein n=1 Tax=Bacillus sp. HMF5848 TaxID=2495421 RepID=UPI000F792365|nr:GrpB family protein [Bacillus sp. HMF5848]RSK27165.1 GrpB family protein [Bacillus sp. HMF5848]
MRKVEVVPYKEEWKTLFEMESKNIKGIFKEHIVNVYHIGSTAIPNINAKPVIDIMAEVYDICVVDNFNVEMEKLGYKAHGEHGIRKRRFYSKGGDARTHHVHIFEKESVEINRHLTFRDYMIAHPEDAIKYSELKQELAHKFSTNIDKYIEGKDSFIKAIDIKAKQWKDQVQTTNK